MSSNYNFNLLRQFFCKEDDKKKEESKIIEAKGMGKKKDTQKQEIIKKEQKLDIPKTLRSEFHFLKFPFFNLCTRQSKMEEIEILEEEETEEGKIEIWWRVSRNIKTNFPSSFARKLHKEVIEKTLNKLKKPVSRLIKLGSFNQICRNMDIVISGKNKKDIKAALKDIRGAKIEAKGTFRVKEKNGGKKFIEGDFNLYDAVYFTGEKLPDGQEADAVYVLLSDYYIQNFNNNFVVPIDYQYFHSLEGDIASRMYEVLSVWFYPALENGKNFIEKQYLEICNYFPLTRQDTKWKAKGQLKRAHKQHISSGLLAREPEWMDIGEKGNWLIRYYIGVKAKDWHKQNKRIKAIENIQQIEEKTQNEIDNFWMIEKQNKIEENPFVVQLTDLGVSKKVAENLVKNGDPEVITGWTKAVHETKAKDKAAFVVKAIEEKWELPEIFKRKREEEEKQKELQHKHENQSKLFKQYEEYKNKAIDTYLNQLTIEQKQERLKQIKEDLYKKCPYLKTWEGETIEDTIGAIFQEEVKKKAKPLGFEEWKKEQEIAI